VSPARLLAARDPILARAVDEVGPPTERFTRPQGFTGLLRMIVEQQLSTRVAEVLWAKLEARVPALTPGAFLALDDETLRACGFSRQKQTYGRTLAESVADGSLDFDRLATLDDAEAVAELVRLKGIGRWTAEIYLMGALGRPDIFPADDLALQVGLQQLAGWEERPSPKKLLERAEAWRPHRSLAAEIIWRHYETKRRKG
jgi:DNA-3-methyladenine glycosylase II